MIRDTLTRKLWKTTGWILAVLIGVTLALAACTALQGRETTKSIRTVTGVVDIPVVSEAGLGAYLEGVEQRFAQISADMQAAKENPAQPMGVRDWLYAILGVGSSGAAYAAAKKAAAAKDAQQGQQRDAEQATNLEALAAAVGKLIALPKEQRTPELIAKALTEALPGDAAVDTEEVAAKAA